MKYSLRVMGISILTVLLAVSLTSCEGKDKGGNSSGEDTKAISGNVVEKGPVTEWEVLTSEAMKLYNSGDYAQGVEVAKRALKVAQQNDGPDHPNVALGLSNLAELYEAQKEYAKAEPLYKRSLEILEKRLAKTIHFWCQLF